MVELKLVAQCSLNRFDHARHVSCVLFTFCSLELSVSWRTTGEVFVCQSEGAPVASGLFK